MSLTRQIDAARVARLKEEARITAQMKALRAADDALISEGKLDVEIALMLRAREILPTLTEVQQQHIRAREYDSSLVRKGVCHPRKDAVVWGMSNALSPLGLTLHAMLTGTPPTLPVLRRLAQHAIDAHCAACAADGRNTYDGRADLEKYLDLSRHHLIKELRILADYLLPSEALTVLLSLLPPENE